MRAFVFAHDGEGLGSAVEIVLEVVGFGIERLDRRERVDDLEDHGDAERGDDVVRNDVKVIASYLGTDERAIARSDAPQPVRPTAH